MIAYHGDETLKARLVAEMEAHRAQDQIVQGQYGAGDGGDFRGCAVGCALHSLFHIGVYERRTWDRHELFEPLAGIPQILARLCDKIFEGLPADEAPAFAVAFWAAPRPGADLSGVWDQFALRLLSDPERGAGRHASERARPAIAGVVALYERQVAGDRPTQDEWRSAAAAAAAYAAADAAAYAAADAAYAAAYAAADAAAAAYAVADAAAADAADAAAYAAYTETRQDHFRWQAGVLLGLLAEA